MLTSFKLMSMKLSFFVFTLLTVFTAYGQQVTNVVLVDKDGVTNDVRKAESFIIIKQFPKTFERLDYKKDGPMIKLRSYKDSSLVILDGRYFEFRLNGTMLFMGNYKDNEKSGDWLTYNDTGKVTRHLKFEKDVLIETLGVDTVVSNIKYGDEREAEFTGGKNKWKAYLEQSLLKGGAIQSTLYGGTVNVIFNIDSTGQVTLPFISKSVDFVIDEEAIQIISESPKWIPAWQNGRPIKAYRKQPIAYMPPVDK